jgi:hypothetical protein
LKLREDLGIRHIVEEEHQKVENGQTRETLQQTSAAMVMDFFRSAEVDAFACTHTCVPFGQVFEANVDVAERGGQESRGRRGVDGSAVSCRRQVAIINNGSAGMPNFAGHFGRFGLMTRIEAIFHEEMNEGKDAGGRGDSDGGYGGPHDSIYGAVVNCGNGWRLRLDALPVRYDRAAFESRFTRTWPEGSSAHISYHERITMGLKNFEPRQAARPGFLLCE